MVEVPNNSSTQLQRDKLAEQVKEFDAILKPGGQIIYLGTPQNEASLYNELQNRGYTCRIWTVQYPLDEAERASYGTLLAPMIANRFDKEPDKWAGKPTDPKRFDEIEIAKRKLSYGKAGFALQFMLNTNLSDYEKYPLKVADLIVDSLDINETSTKWSWASGLQQRLADIPCVALKGDMYYAPLSRSEDTKPYGGTVMAIDASGRGHDETAFAIVKFLNGYLFLMEVGGFLDGYSDLTITQLAQKAKFWGVNEVVNEANFGDGMFTKVMTPIFSKIHPCVISEVRNIRQKELRIIDTLEPVLMSHKLIVNRSVIEDDYRVYERQQTYSLFYQMTRISKDKNSLAHDDRLDAVTMAVSYWLDRMDVNVEEEDKAEKDRILDNWLEYGIIASRYKAVTNGSCIKNIADLRKV